MAWARRDWNGYRQIDYVVTLEGDGTAEQYAAIHAAVQATSPNFFNMDQANRHERRPKLNGSPLRGALASGAQKGRRIAPPAPLV